MLRLFAAIEVPAAIGTHLTLMQAGLAGAKWRPEQNFHITLRFIGDVAAPLERDIDSAFGQVRAPAFTLRLRGVGMFGKDKPRAVWAGVEDSQPLHHLAAKIETAVQKIGLEAERRKYAPHVTLAYLRGAQGRQVQDYVAAHGGFHSAAFTVSRFVLYQSHMGKRVSTYRPRRRYDLNTAAQGRETWLWARISAS